MTLAESIGTTPHDTDPGDRFLGAAATGRAPGSRSRRPIDRALEKRPDLIARVAALRASEAEVGRARAAYWPTLSLVGDVGSILGNARITADGKSTGWFGATQPSYGVGLSLEWEIFDGGARQRQVELAESTRRAAQDEITATRDRAVSDVWKAYTDVKLAFRRLDVAAALVDASQQAVRGFAQVVSCGARHAHRPPRRSPRAESRTVRRARHESPAAGLFGGARVHDRRDPRHPHRPRIGRGRPWDRKSTSSARSSRRGCSAPRSASLSPCSRGRSSSGWVWIRISAARARLSEPRASRHPRPLGGAVPGLGRWRRAVAARTE